MTHPDPWGEILNEIEKAGKLGLCFEPPDRCPMCGRIR